MSIAIAGVAADEPDAVVVVVAVILGSPLADFLELEDKDEDN